MLSRVAVASLVVLGGGATVAGGVLLTKVLTGPDAVIVDDLDRFRKEGHREGCVGSLFGDGIVNVAEDMAKQEGQ